MSITGSKKRIILSVSNDLLIDQRVHKTANSLFEQGWDVLVLGRKYRNSPELSLRAYPTQRLHLIFRKGFLFYAELNIRFFLYLLFQSDTCLYANDLDTLPANFLVSRIRRFPIIYDSHEYFTEVPELVDRPAVKAIWERLEAAILPNLPFAMTVCDSIARVYSEKYRIPVYVIRNLPLAGDSASVPSYNPDSKVILYQGALNKGRGLEFLIDAMSHTSGLECWIVGDGDIRQALEQKVTSLNLTSKVKFWGRIPFQGLNDITAKAALGVSLEENLGLNYYYALPNKLFDYIRAGVPVLASDLPEISSVVNRYKVGWLVETRHPAELAQIIQDKMNEPEARIEISHNCLKASPHLVWEVEIETLFRLLAS